MYYIVIFILIVIVYCFSSHYIKIPFVSPENYAICVLIDGIQIAGPYNILNV